MKYHFAVMAGKVFYQINEGHLLLLGKEEEIRVLSPTELYQLITLTLLSQATQLDEEEKS
jgi:hypothetical protein